MGFNPSPDCPCRFDGGMDDIDIVRLLSVEVSDCKINNIVIVFTALTSITFIGINDIVVQVLTDELSGG